VVSTTPSAISPETSNSTGHEKSRILLIVNASDTTHRQSAATKKNIEHENTAARSTKSQTQKQRRPRQNPRATLCTICKPSLPDVALGKRGRKQLRDFPNLTSSHPSFPFRLTHDEEDQSVSNSPGCVVVGFFTATIAPRLFSASLGLRRGRGPRGTPAKPLFFFVLTVSGTLVSTVQLKCDVAATFPARSLALRQPKQAKQASFRVKSPWRTFVWATKLVIRQSRPQ